MQVTDCAERHVGGQDAQAVVEGVSLEDAHAASFSRHASGIATGSRRS